MNNNIPYALPPPQNRHTAEMTKRLLEFAGSQTENYDEMEYKRRMGEMRRQRRIQQRKEEEERRKTESAEDVFWRAFQDFGVPSGYRSTRWFLQQNQPDDSDDLD